MITLELLKAINPSTKVTVLQQFVEPLNDVCKYYDMFDAPARVAAFLAQISHESAGLTATKENLNYSAKGLMGTFGKYFATEELAKSYERQPEKIANRVYANRMGNGPESSGDGWKHRGRGLIQLTGKDNYTRFATGLGITVDDCVAYLETIPGACSSAGWFWDNNNLNSYCDRGDFIGLTKRINGGTKGIEDRQQKYQKALSFLQG